MYYSFRSQKKMQNEAGEYVDMYTPRKWWVNHLYARVWSFKLTSFWVILLYRLAHLHSEIGKPSKVLNFCYRTFVSLELRMEVANLEGKNVILHVFYTRMLFSLQLRHQQCDCSKGSCFCAD